MMNIKQQVMHDISVEAQRNFKRGAFLVPQQCLSSQVSQMVFLEE